MIRLLPRTSDGVADLGLQSLDLWNASEGCASGCLTKVNRVPKCQGASGKYGISVYYSFLPNINNPMC